MQQTFELYKIVIIYIVEFDSSTLETERTNLNTL